VEISVIQWAFQSGFFLVRLQETQRFLAMIREDEVRWVEHRKNGEETWVKRGKDVTISRVKCRQKNFPLPSAAYATFVKFTDKMRNVLREKVWWLKEVAFVKFMKCLSGFILQQEKNT